MKEPILSREQVLKIVRKTLKENNDRDKLSSDRFVALASAFEEALLEKLCGEPIYQVWIEETSSYADVTAEYYAERLPSNRRIVYALNRSKA